jgi:hypothetical protein
MVGNSSQLTPTTLIGTAAQHLAENGYRVVREPLHPALPTDRALLAEDPYSVVAVAAFDNWTQLESDWTEAQGALVEILNRRLTRADPKAWDGYLILLCAGPADTRDAVARIERDTSRVRKLVAAGADLVTTADVMRALAPLLPLRAEEQADQLTDPLSLLPELLKNEVPMDATRAVVDAFRGMEPPLEKLHEVVNS